MIQYPGFFLVHPGRTGIGSGRSGVDPLEVAPVATPIDPEELATAFADALESETGRTPSVRSRRVARGAIRLRSVGNGRTASISTWPG